MPRTFTLVSVTIHAMVIGGVYVAQTVSTGPLPLVHDALAFADQTMVPVKIADIALPPPAPRTSPSSAPSVSPAAAPIESPSAVTPETGHEREVVPSRSTGPGSGVEQAGDIGSALAIPGATLAPPPAPPAPQPIHLHAGIQPPKKIVDVKPIYPALALTARQEGVVILETIIDVRGGVETVHVLRGYQLLDQAAIDAVRQWRFTPALLNGQAVPVVMTVTVTFSLK